MSRQYWAEPVWWIEATPTAVSGTSETILAPDFVMPANFLNDGRMLELIMYGQYSNIITTPGTLEFWIRYGGVAGTLLATSAALSLNIIAQTNQMFRLHALLTTRATGATGSVFVTGDAELSVQLAASNNAEAFMGSAGAASPAAVTIDTTAQNNLSVTAKFSLTGNSIQALNYVVKALN